MTWRVPVTGHTICSTSMKLIEQFCPLAAQILFRMQFPSKNTPFMFISVIS